MLNIETLEKQLSFISEQISQISLQTEKLMYIPKWIRVLMDKGLVDTDGKTVIANRLDSVVYAIDEQGIVVTNVMLKRFVNGKTGRPYSESSITRAIDLLNAK